MVVLVYYSSGYLVIISTFGRRTFNALMFVNVVASWLALCTHQKYTQLTMFCSSEDALRNASMFFRSEPTWSVVEPLKDIGESGVYQCVCSIHLCDIGWRIRKQYYVIASKTDHRLPKHMLSWVC